MTDAVPISHTTGPLVDGNPIEIGLVPNSGARLPGGSTCGLALQVWIATRSCRFDRFRHHRALRRAGRKLLKHADDAQPGFLRLAGRNLGASKRRDVADRVAAIDKSG